MNVQEGLSTRGQDVVEAQRQRKGPRGSNRLAHNAAIVQPTPVFSVFRAALADGYSYASGASPPDFVIDANGIGERADQRKKSVRLYVC